MLDKAIPAGLDGDKLSRIVTGTDEASAGRSVVATGSSAGQGFLAASGAGVGLEAVGLTAAAALAGPLVVPCAVLAGGIALVASLFE